MLNPTNVNSATFGKLFSYSIDGISFASPLYAAVRECSGMGLPQSRCYVVTEHDSVYAFDADGLTNNPVWKVSFINPAAGVTTVPSPETTEPFDVPGEVGITGTPVINPTNGTLYVVATTKEVSGATTNYVMRLHALDITTGAEKFGGPMAIQASVPGTGRGVQGGMVSFDRGSNNQRPALLLNSNVVYIGFSDSRRSRDLPRLGFGLQRNQSSTGAGILHHAQPTEKGGVWHGGGGIAADSAGSLYFSTGNGHFDANKGSPDYGDTVLKINPGGTVLDYFTPFNQAFMETNDVDLSPGGVLLLPDQTGSYPHLMIAVGKFGSIYLINRDNMGHYSAKQDTNIVQELSGVLPDGNYQGEAGYDLGNRINPVYFNGNVYFSCDNDYIRCYRLSSGLLSTTPTSKSAEQYLYPGAPLAISANGTNNGILWVVERFGLDAAGMGETWPRAFSALTIPPTCQASFTTALRPARGTRWISPPSSVCRSWSTEKSSWPRSAS